MFTFAVSLLAEKAGYSRRRAFRPSRKFCKITTAATLYYVDSAGTVQLINGMTNVKGMPTA